MGVSVIQISGVSNIQGLPKHLNCKEVQSGLLEVAAIWYIDVCCFGLTTIQGSTVLIGVSLSELHNSGTALCTYMHVYAWTDHLL